MFASKERTLDPQPWTIVSPDPDLYGKRVALPGNFNHWSGSDQVYYLPRHDEFDKHLLDVNPILNWMRIESMGDDVYTHSVSWLFAISDYLAFTMMQNVPEEWGYRPSAAGPETDAPEHETLHEIHLEIATTLWGGEDEMNALLLHAGRVLHLIITQYNLAGKGN